LRCRRCWEPLDRAELPLLELVGRVRRGGLIERATRVLTVAGEHGALWYAIAGLGAWRDQRRREQWISAGAKVGAVYAANTAIKLAARRHRPPVADLGAPSALSFPSSHAATSFGAARLYSELVPPARPLLYGGALAVTASRLHFRVHYPSDLLAGALAGDLLARVLSTVGPGEGATLRPVSEPHATWR
jgi:undecaprenyl-diphosphatase